MMKKITIYLFASFFMMSFATSAFAKITLSSEFNFNKYLQYEGTVQSCEDQGYLTNKPLHSKCDTYKGCFINCECLNGYVKVDGVCTENDCSAYPKTSCLVSSTTPYKTVTFCETDSSKCKYTECQNGYTLNDGNCVCTGSGVVESSGVCQCDADEGWTPKSGDYAPCQEIGCPLGSSTNPNCGTNEEASYTGDKSGGQKCYKCVSTYQCSVYYTAVSECGSEIGWSLVDDGTTDKDGKKCQECSCSATDHTLTAKPNATTTNFTTGCNGKYKITSCKDGYELSGNSCVEKQQPQGFQCCTAYYQESSGTQRIQYSPIGRYLSSWDSYERCLSSSNMSSFTINNPYWTRYWSGTTSDSSSIICKAGSYSDLKTCLNYHDHMKHYLTIQIVEDEYDDDDEIGDIDATEDIIIKSRIIDSKELRVQLYPSALEETIGMNDVPISRVATISSLNHSIELGRYTNSISISYSTPILIIHDGVSLYNSLIKADRIYLKGKVYFNNVKIQSLYSDHIDIYIGSDDYSDRDYDPWNCYQSTYLHEDLYQEAEHCTPMIGFYSSNPGYPYIDSNDYYQSTYATPLYYNEWGTLATPVIFHKETSDTLDGVIFSNDINNGVTIYGYNGDSSPVFSELKFNNHNINGHTLEPLNGTMQFNLKNYPSNTIAPLFRRFQTYEYNPDMAFKTELNIYHDVIPSSNDNAKMASVVNEIKTNSYLSSDNTCSLGTASSYVYARDFDTNECSVYEECNSLGLYDEEIYYENSYIGTAFSEWYDYCDYCRVYSSNYEETEEEWLNWCGDADERIEICDLTEREYGAFEAVSTRCDGQTWKNQFGDDVAWNKCYKHSQVYCLNANEEESEEFGYCSESQINWLNEIEGSNAQDHLCAEITDADNPGEVCDRLLNANGETYPSFSYKITDYKKHVDGSLRLNGSKCLVCSFYQTNNGNNG